AAARAGDSLPLAPQAVRDPLAQPFERHDFPGRERTLLFPAGKIQGGDKAAAVGDGPLKAVLQVPSLEKTGERMPPPAFEPQQGHAIRRPPLADQMEKNRVPVAERLVLPQEGLKRA